MNLSSHSLVLLFLLLLLLLGMVASRPAMQRLWINDHMWEVPDEDGWEDVIREAEPVRHLLQKCTSAAECHHVVKQLRDVLYRHSVSRQYLEAKAKNDADDLLQSIFKWG